MLRGGRAWFWERKERRGGRGPRSLGRVPSEKRSEGGQEGENPRWCVFPTPFSKAFEAFSLQRKHPGGRGSELYLYLCDAESASLVRGSEGRRDISFFRFFADDEWKRRDAVLSRSLLALFAAAFGAFSSLLSGSGAD